MAKTAEKIEELEIPDGGIGDFLRGKILFSEGEFFRVKITLKVAGNSR